MHPPVTTKTRNVSPLSNKQMSTLERTFRTSKEHALTHEHTGHNNTRSSVARGTLLLVAFARPFRGFAPFPIPTVPPSQSFLYHVASYPHSGASSPHSTRCAGYPHSSAILLSSCSLRGRLLSRGCERDPARGCGVARSYVEREGRKPVSSF